MSRKEDPKVTELVIKVMGQAAVCDIVDTDEHRQANVYLPPSGGASFFALFDIGMSDADIEQALMPVLRGDPLDEDKEVTDLIEGSVFAGTIARPVVHLQRR